MFVVHILSTELRKIEKKIINDNNNLNIMEELNKSINQSIITCNNTEKKCIKKGTFR